MGWTHFTGASSRYHCNSDEALSTICKAQANTPILKFIIFIFLAVMQSSYSCPHCSPRTVLSCHSRHVTSILSWLYHHGCTYIHCGLVMTAMSALSCPAVANRSHMQCFRSAFVLRWFGYQAKLKKLNPDPDHFVSGYRNRIDLYLFSIS